VRPLVHLEIECFIRGNKDFIKEQQVLHQGEYWWRYMCSPLVSGHRSGATSPAVGISAEFEFSESGPVENMHCQFLNLSTAPLFSANESSRDV
jgi:hypothetical protein